MNVLIFWFFVVSNTLQTQAKVDILLNGEIVDLDLGISRDAFEGSFIQLNLAEGEKIDPSKPLSGEIFVRSDYLAAYMAYFENLEEKIFLLDSIRTKTKHRIKLKDHLVVRIENVKNEGELIYTIKFRK